MLRPSETRRNFEWGQGREFGRCRASRWAWLPARAQLLIHESPGAAVEALANTAIPVREPQGLETIVGLYGPAVPLTPQVSAEGLAKEVDLLPAHRPAPDLSGIDPNDFVDNRFAEQAAGGGQ